MTRSTGSLPRREVSRWLRFAKFDWRGARELTRLGRLMCFLHSPPKRLVVRQVDELVFEREGEREERRSIRLDTTDSRGLVARISSTLFTLDSLFLLDLSLASRQHLDYPGNDEECRQTSRVTGRWELDVLKGKWEPPTLFTSPKRTGLVEDWNRRREGSDSASSWLLFPTCDEYLVLLFHDRIVWDLAFIFAPRWPLVVLVLSWQPCVRTAIFA